MIVGAAYVAARSSEARERQIGGDGPAPTKFAAPKLPFFRIEKALNSFYAQSFVQIVVKVVKIKYCPV